MARKQVWVNCMHSTSVRTLRSHGEVMTCRHLRSRYQHPADKDGLTPRIRDNGWHIMAPPLLLICHSFPVNKHKHKHKHTTITTKPNTTQYNTTQDKMADSRHSLNSSERTSRQRAASPSRRSLPQPQWTSQRPRLRERRPARLG